MKKSPFYLLLLGGVLMGFLIGFLLKTGGEPVVRYIYETDTIVESHIDTLTEYYPEPYADTVVEYVEVSGDTVLSVHQKHYHSDSTYDVWVSGIEPLSLDSINVCNKTEFVTVTNTITNTILDERWRVYGFGGFSHVCERFVPEVGVSISSPQKWLISAKIGYDTKLGTTYGINIGYKIF